MKSKNKVKLALNYQFVQIPDNYSISECAFHMNSLFLRQTGLIKEEIILLAHSLDSEENAQAVVKVFDLDAIIADFNNEFTCVLDH